MVCTNSDFVQDKFLAQVATCTKSQFVLNINIFKPRYFDCRSTAFVLSV